MYFLLTNTYKYDLTNFNIRARHFIWRTDQWATGRMKQWLEKENQKPGNVDDDAANRMEDVASASASVASSYPIPSVLKEADISSTLWHEWLTLTTDTSAAREPIDELIWPLIRPLEEAVDPPHVYAADQARMEKKVAKQKAKEDTSSKAASESSIGDGPISKYGRPIKQLRKSLAEVDESGAMGGGESDTELGRKSGAGRLKRKKDASSDDEDHKGDTDTDDPASSTSSDTASGSDEDGVGGAESGATSGRRRSFLTKRPRRRSGAVKSDIKQVLFAFERACRYPIDRIAPNVKAAQVTPIEERKNRWYEGEMWKDKGRQAFNVSQWKSYQRFDELLRNHNGIEVESDSIDFTSNGHSYHLPIGACLHSNIAQPSSLSSSSASMTSPPDVGIDAFLNIGLPVTSMAWCPTGVGNKEDKYESIRQEQYLCVAVDHQEDCQYKKRGGDGASLEKSAISADLRPLSSVIHLICLCLFSSFFVQSSLSPPLLRTVFSPSSPLRSYHPPPPPLLSVLRLVSHSH